jgi:hypothetical protein
MHPARRLILSLGLLACAGMAAYPPWVEARVHLPQEQWQELFAPPSETAAGYAPVWSPPQAWELEDYGHTIRVTYRLDGVRLAAQMVGVACLTVALWVAVGPRRSASTR